ncbi:MAG: hypothetical protein ACXAEE_04670 [Candidatus Thorarchaeota archaeon]
MSMCPAYIITLAIIVLMYVKWPDYGRMLWHCLARYTTLRPCDITFHDKARATFTSILMRVHSRLGRAAYQRFDVVSVVMVILLLIFIWNWTTGFILSCILGI